MAAKQRKSTMVIFLMFLPTIAVCTISIHALYFTTLAFRFNNLTTTAMTKKKKMIRLFLQLRRAVVPATEAAHFPPRGEGWGRFSDRLGLVGGFVFWQFWGCTDSCPISSSWKLSVLRGGVIGLCVAAIIRPSDSSSTKNEIPS